MPSGNQVLSRFIKDNVRGQASYRHRKELPYQHTRLVHAPGWRTAPEAVTFQSWQLCAGFDWGVRAVVLLQPQKLVVAVLPEACRTEEAAVAAVAAEGIGSEEVDTEAVVAR